VGKGIDMSGQRDLEGMRALVTGATSGLGKAIAEELGRQGAEAIGSSRVRVNSIAPRPVLTGVASPDRTEALGATTLPGRAAQPGEISEVIAFLASPKASSITGALVAPDGGRTAV
jgi:NAD(P)-dependent dehydrogenase (short-subunit alcohol dehydrogenase family)